MNNENTYGSTQNIESSGDMDSMVLESPSGSTDATMEDAKAFVGGDLRGFARMFTGQHSWSWSWMAFLYGPFWLAYRKLWGHAVFIGIFWFTPIALLIMIIYPLFAKRIYYKKFLNVVSSAPKNQPERAEYLAQKGGRSWIGLTVALVILLPWAVLMAFVWDAPTLQRPAEVKAFLEAPAVGDIYTVDFRKIFTETNQRYPHGALRIVKVSAGMVVFDISKVGYNKPAAVSTDVRQRKVDEAAYWSDSVSMTPQEVKELYNQKGISRIDRRQSWTPMVGQRLEADK